MAFDSRRERRGHPSAGGTRLGGASQNNIMMDGISAMDTGNNGQMLHMNIESIGEVKVLTQGYQAEYGRSSGLQITAVTKSGTNQFRGSGYGVFTDSDWNKHVGGAEERRHEAEDEARKIYGYTIGGPVWASRAGSNKLFFFYAHEFRPHDAAINGGNPIRYRVPSALERAGDFSQSRDNNGNPIPTLMDYTTGRPSRTRRFRPTGCMPPAWRCSTAIRSRTSASAGDELQLRGAWRRRTISWPSSRPSASTTRYRTKLRFTGKYSGQRERPLTRPGLIPGFTDVMTPYPYITNYAVTVNYVFNPTTFIEGTYGRIQNELAGGNETGILVNEESNRLKSLKDFPLLYPNAGVDESGLLRLSRSWS